MNYITNPWARLLHQRHEFRNYQYKFEYKQGKLNRGVEALSRNPIIKDVSSDVSDSENSKDSDGSFISVFLQQNSKQLTKPSKSAKVLVLTRSGVSQDNPNKNNGTSNHRAPLNKSLVQRKRCNKWKESLPYPGQPPLSQQGSRPRPLK